MKTLYRILTRLALVLCLPSVLVACVLAYNTAHVVVLERGPWNYFADAPDISGLPVPPLPPGYTLDAAPANASPAPSAAAPLPPGTPIPDDDAPTSWTPPAPSWHFDDGMPEIMPGSPVAVARATRELMLLWTLLLLVPPAAVGCLAWVVKPEAGSP